MTDAPAVPSPPSDLRPRGRGRRFWRDVLGTFELAVDELELLAEACRQLDLLDALRAAAGDEVVVDGKTHPAIVEARHTRIELRRSLAQLNLPQEGADEVTDEVAAFRSQRARRAARARWDAGGV